MAVRLKTHTKVMIAVAIMAVSCAAAWQLGVGSLVKGLLPSGEQGEPGEPSTPKVYTTGPLGSTTNPLKVSIVSWHGYAPALLANGNSLKTAPGSLYEKEGVAVEFLLQDDLPTLAANFSGEIAHCSWRTIDFFAQEHPTLRQNQMDAKIVMIVDNSKGSDAIISKSAHSVEDLAGKSVALVQYTPSHMVLVHALEQSSLTARKKESIGLKFIGSTAEVRAAYEAGQVDAAVLWEPDTSLALKRVPGSKVVYSTKTASNLIYDVMVCDAKAIAEKPDAIQKFVTGWMKGVEAAEADAAAATAALVATEPLFEQLIKDEGNAFMKDLYAGVQWTGLEENIRILGMAGATNFGERVYAQSDKIWRENTDLIAKETAVIAPKDAFDYRFIQSLADADAKAKEEAKKPEYTFTDTEREKATTQAEAQVTKPVSINFAPGSAELSKRAMQSIDAEMVPLLDSMGGAYFSVEGNTDSTGSKAANTKLSQARAEAVVTYLVTQWEFPRERFRVSGNGPEKPFCDEKNPQADDMTVEECMAANRRTDVAVYSR